MQRNTHIYAVGVMIIERCGVLAVLFGMAKYEKHQCASVRERPYKLWNVCTMK